MKLYVNVEKHPREKIVSFLKRCYDEGQYSYNYTFCETYYDVYCTKLQCYKKRRSFDELLTVVKTYYPHASKKHIASQIKKLTKPLSICNKMHLRFLFCPDVQKWVMYESSNNASEYYIYLSNYNNSKSKFEEKGNGERSLKDILTLMGYDETTWFV